MAESNGVRSVKGAAEVLSFEPDHASARSLLSDAADAMAVPCRAVWPWPERRLTYANATLPEAMIAAGSALGRPALLRHGLDLLEWLVDRESNGGHLSVTPAGGSGPGNHGPGFDQQPIEVAALADACARAPGLSTTTRAGRKASAWQQRGSAATTTSARSCGIPTPGGLSTGWSRRHQPQSGHRVHARPPVDPAARTVRRRRPAMKLEASRLIRRSPVHMAAARSRVVTRLFVPGQEGFDHQDHDPLQCSIACWPFRTTRWSEAMRT